MDKPVVDPRLAALYDEYVRKDKESEFLFMLYVILHFAFQEARTRARYAWSTWLRKHNEAKHDKNVNEWKTMFHNMSVKQIIKYQNTPYEKLPDALKRCNGRIVRKPCKNHYVRMYGLVPDTEAQKEITSSRITRYMEEHGFITSNQEGIHLDYKRFAEVCNEIGKYYDLRNAKGKRISGVRITARNIENYVEDRVTPKGDKFALLSVATGMPVKYLGGYGSVTMPPPSDPLTPYHK